MIPRSSIVWCGLALVPALGATTSGASAQSAVSAFASASAAEHRVDIGYGVDRFSGVVLGFGTVVRWRPRVVTVLTVQGGTLEARSARDLERRVADVAVDARYAVGSWFSLTGGVGLRSVANDVGRQRWVLVRFGGEARPAFMGTPMRAVLRAGVIPVVAVNGLPAPTLALHAATGLEYDRGSFTFRALYGVERFDFPLRNGTRRLEQVSALTLRAGVRLHGGEP